MYDLIIIGGGVAGLGSAIYAQRFGLKTLILTEFLGGTITYTHLVENYPGFKSISGPELSQKLQEHAENLKTEIQEKKVKKIEKKNRRFEVHTDNQVFEAKTILLSTGTEQRQFQIKGAQEFKNRGVSYCAACDAAFYQDKIVGVVGGSDAAVKEALLLAEYAKKVYIIYRRKEVRAESINKERMKKNPKIEVITQSNVVEIYGKEKVEGVKLDTGKNLPLDGLFIEIGRIPRSELAENLGVELNEKGEIKIDRYAKTNIPGVFAAGDVTDNSFKQAITGVAEGVAAAFSAYRYLTSQS